MKFNQEICWGNSFSAAILSDVFSPQPNPQAKRNPETNYGSKNHRPKAGNQEILLFRLFVSKTQRPRKNQVVFFSEGMYIEMGRCTSHESTWNVSLQYLEINIRAIPRYKSCTWKGPAGDVTIWFSQMVNALWRLWVTNRYLRCMKSVSKFRRGIAFFAVPRKEGVFPNTLGKQ